MSNLVFTPTLIIHGTRYEFPRPVLSLRLLDAWDFAKFKVPLRDGDVIAGRSQGGLDVQIEGQIGTQAGVLQGTETAMFLTLNQLRGLAAELQDTDCRFVLYRDAETGEDHLLHSCTLVRFEYDLSDTHLFTYAATIHASDPVIYIEPATPS